jgi:hypothetical protein
MFDIKLNFDSSVFPLKILFLPEKSFLIWKHVFDFFFCNRTKMGYDTDDGA